MSAQAQWGAFATLAPTRTNVSNSAQVGIALNTKKWDDADIGYSFKATATTTSDTVTLTLTSGAVSTGGSPTLSDNAVSHEGKSLTALVTIYAIIVEQTVAGSLQVEGDLIRSNYMNIAGAIAFGVWPAGITPASETLVLDMNAVGAACTVTVIGKSS